MNMLIIDDLAKLSNLVKGIILILK